MPRSNRPGRRGLKPGAGRETDLRRRSPSRDQRVSVLIGTNGKVTERSYFSEVKELGWVTAGRVVVAYEHGSPVDAVRSVGRRKADNDFDHAWVVCDVDDFDPATAAREAKKQDVSIAWSNPCGLEAAPGGNPATEVWRVLEQLGYPRP
ncbi:RloB family protein [Actinoplanes sp. RD1]|uniref:RloB family protein n=1 Tax=Actinoplanes sp. RD1 TaxID=3064538 RepID=UPI002740AAFC|nr:RloB family protein [Actinoplanes sp. RD1]